jgi:hypothetical protein
MEEQLPSGILIFFALFLFLAAALVFFSGGEGVDHFSAGLGIAFVVLGGFFVWFVGYGEQEANLSEATGRTGSETTVEETASTPGSTGQSQGEEANYEAYCVQKQFAEATQGMDRQQAIDYDTGVVSEAVARGLDPRTILTERGFPC